MIYTHKPYQLISNAMLTLQNAIFTIIIYIVAKLKWNQIIYFMLNWFFKYCLCTVFCFVFLNYEKKFLCSFFVVIVVNDDCTFCSQQFFYHVIHSVQLYLYIYNYEINNDPYQTWFNFQLFHISLIRSSVFYKNNDNYGCGKLVFLLSHSCESFWIIM